jgi:hypothetical protein
LIYPYLGSLTGIPHWSRSFLDRHNREQFVTTWHNRQHLVEDARLFPCIRGRHYAATMTRFSEQLLLVYQPTSTVSAPKQQATSYYCKMSPRTWKASVSYCSEHLLTTNLPLAYLFVPKKQIDVHSSPRLSRTRIHFVQAGPHPSK